VSGVVEKVAAGVGDALSAVMLALLELPRFEDEQYLRLLARVLKSAEADEGDLVGDALEKIGGRLPARPLLGEVRARIEAALVEDARYEAGVRLDLGTVSGRFGWTSDRRSAGTVAAEIAARYDEPEPFDFEGLRSLMVGDLLKLVDAGGEA